VFGTSLLLHGTRVGKRKGADKSGRCERCSRFGGVGTSRADQAALLIVQLWVPA
jgi:hypothetical protein